MKQRATLRFLEGTSIDNHWYSYYCDKYYVSTMGRLIQISKRHNRHSTVLHEVARRQSWELFCQNAMWFFDKADNPSMSTNIEVCGEK